jgi:hypothetical protein
MLPRPAVDAIANTVFVGHLGRVSAALRGPIGALLTSIWSSFALDTCHLASFRSSLPDFTPAVDQH